MSLQEAQEKLHRCEQAYEEAVANTRAARSIETDLLNKLNDAQKAFDSVVADIKQNTTGGDWKNKPGFPEKYP